MSEPGPNPYAPPTGADEAADRSEIGEWLRSGEISFQGTLTGRDLKAFLRAHDYIGCGSMLMTGTGVAFILGVVAVVVGGGMGLIALGVMGWLALTLLTSLLSYRRSVFTSANPAWDAPIRGGLSREGMEVTRGKVRSFYRWDWFADAVVDAEVVAFRPALHPHQPILISSSMMSELEGWDRALTVAGQIMAEAGTRFTPESRRYDNRRLLRSDRRVRSIPVGEGAVAFEGVVSMDDLRHLPPVLVRRNRPTRAYLLIVALAVSASLVMIGMARLGGLDTVLPTLLFSAVVLVVMVGFLVRRIRSLRGAGDTVYYLMAQADKNGITSDFGVTTTFVPWESLDVSESDDDVVVLSRIDLRQYIIVRRDMFADAAEWNQFGQWVRQRRS
jgi:hypothetical protein